MINFKGYNKKSTFNKKWNKKIAEVIHEINLKFIFREIAADIREVEAAALNIIPSSATQVQIPVLVIDYISL